MVYKRIELNLVHFVISITELKTGDMFSKNLEQYLVKRTNISQFYRAKICLLAAFRNSTNLTKSTEGIKIVNE